MVTFDRLKREVKLTAHAAAFLRRARHIPEEVDADHHEATDAKALLRGPVRAGVPPTIASYLFPGGR